VGCEKKNKWREKKGDQIHTKSNENNCNSSSSNSSVTGQH